MAQIGRYGLRKALLLPELGVIRRLYCSRARGGGDDSTSTSSTTSGQGQGSIKPNSQSQPSPLLRDVDVDVNVKLPPSPSPCSNQIAGDVENHFDFSQSFKRSETWRTKLVHSMLVYPDFISGEEEANILKEIEPYLSRLHYEESHWDDAIHAYRETERSKWNKGNEKIISRIRGLAFPPHVPQLKLVHILDLAKNGVIKPHIDSIRFCGNTIGGLSLLSDCVMRLRHDVQKDFSCDIFLPRLSLYVMRDFSRYEFTHEILAESESMFKTSKITRDRRISIICRNEPTTSSAPTAIFTPLAAS